MKINNSIIAGRYFKIIAASFTLIACSCSAQKEKPIKDILKDYFLIGTSVNQSQTSQPNGVEMELINANFNSIVAENCMKSSIIHPERERYDFKAADEFVKTGIDNKHHIQGHCLIWHSQLAPWFCVDENGNNVSADTLKERMREHIYTIVKRYKGKINGWDVANECFEDNGDYRNSPFFQILGKDYINLAFKYAHEADPDAKLCYNDYNMSFPAKARAVVKMVNELKQQGIQIDEIGMQCHLSIDFPKLEEFEKSILAFASTGCKVMITEMDMTVIPFPSSRHGADISLNEEYQEKMNPYKNGIPEDISIKWNNRMNDFFKIFIRNADVITRVNMWGFADQNSWRNDWPIHGRKDYPLLFDRTYKAKPIIKEIEKDVMLIRKQQK
ncbi:MAG: endo-1,4-beta-xylanase [Bacteroidales bacterium]|nr:endo-1,4-beta-xylanase [Bacteroidales bacterium]